MRVELRGFAVRVAGDNFTTVPDLRQQNQTIADYTGQFIVVMGLGAMLIGGVGIVNTMLVMVRRRTEEIAALKDIWPQRAASGQHCLWLKPCC